MIVPKGEVIEPPKISGVGAVFPVPMGSFPAAFKIPKCGLGAGTSNYRTLSFTGSSKTINTTTQTIAGTIAGSTTTAPTAGYLGESITANGTNVSIPASGNTINVTSISLTAGIWDVSALSNWRQSSKLHSCVFGRTDTYGDTSEAIYTYINNYCILMRLRNFFNWSG